MSERPQPRDHGGGLDDAVALFGGTRADWLDLSTGINPHSYPIPEIPAEAWTALPDRVAAERLERAENPHNAIMAFGNVVRQVATRAAYAGRG